MTARRLTLSADAIRAYSRRGNYHSEPAAADALGLPGLVAQGVQVAGPAYDALLAAWGDDFLAHGEVELKFVAMVKEGDTVEARVDIDGDDAHIEVVHVSDGRTAVAGRARRR